MNSPSEVRVAQLADHYEAMAKAFNPHTQQLFFRDFGEPTPAERLAVYYIQRRRARDPWN